MANVGIGGGNVGIGDRFAKSRLLLAKRSGLVGPGFQIAPRPGAASAQWRAASKNLSARAQRAGFANPMQFLRQGAQSGKLPQASPYTQRATGSGMQDPLASYNYANARLGQLRQAAPNMGGFLGQFFQANPQEHFQNPQAVWRFVSGELSRASQAAGYSDPRRFLQAMLSATGRR
jgi:hypothetical protein